MIETCRMQIHFDSTKPANEQIQIFSKSTRNSTTTRSHSHPILRSAFGHRHDYDPVIHQHLHRQIRENLPSSSFDTIQSGIFEAEMICFDEEKGCDELFHKLAATLAGRENILRKGQHESQKSEQSSIQTGQSSMELTRRRFERVKRSVEHNLHLKIVFFVRFPFVLQRFLTDALATGCSLSQWYQPHQWSVDVFIPSRIADPGSQNLTRFDDLDWNE